MARNLGTLTYSLIAEIGGFTGGLDKAGREADKRAKAIQSTVTKIGGAVGVAATAAGAAVADWTRDLVMSATQVERLAALSGASTKSFQEMAYGAKTFGIEQEKLADILKDTQDKIGDFMQTGGGAMADFFEQIAPKVGVTADQFRKLSGPDALQLYVSSLEKAKVSQSEMTFYLEAIASDATALLPLLRNNGTAYQELALKANAYGLVLDSNVIENSKELRRQVQDLEAMYQGFKNEIGSATIPVLVALGKTVKDVTAETGGLEGAVDGLRKSDGMRLFAEDAGRQMAKTMDYIAQTKREFEAIVDAAGLAGRGTKAFFTGDWEGLRKAEEDFRKRFMGDRAAARQAIGHADGRWQGDAERAYEAQLGAAARSRFAQNDPRRLGNVGTIAQQLATAGIGTGTKPKTGGGSTAAQEAAAQLAADLEAIKRSRDTLLNTIGNSEQLLQAMRTAGLTEEGSYYQEKRALLDKQTAAEVKALEQTIGRLQQEKVAGKDAINNTKQIEAAQADLAKVRADAATQAKILSIEEQSSFKAVEASILSARQAAQGLLDTMNQGFNRQLGGIGQGNKFREYQTGLQQIDEQFQRQRQDLQNLRALAESNGPLGPEAQKKFATDLALLEEFHAKSLDSYKGYYGNLEDAQKNWLNGATEALYNYRDEAMNVAKNTEEAFGNAFKGLEDELTNLFTGKGFDAKKLLEEFQGDITRNFVKENITGPLAGLLGDSLGVNLGGMDGAKLGTQSNPMYVKLTESLAGLMAGAPSASSGGWLSSLIGTAGSWFGGLSTGTGASIASALPGDSMDNFLKLMGNFGGARANGGPVSPFSLYKVNERGPELFQMDDGTQLLMTGARGGGIVPNHRLRGGGGVQQVNNITIQGQVDRRTISQIEMSTARSARLATGRLS